jgi:CheY-like chemotaxis protein
MVDQSSNEARKVLMATRADLRTPSWVDRAATARQALEMWRVHQHEYVFADMGDLGDGMTGARLSMTLRKEAQGHRPVVVLLCDTLAEHNLQRAKLSGANAVVRRDEAAIAAAFPPAPQQVLLKETVSGIPSEFPACDVPRALVAKVEARLQSIARMGPARSIVVADAIEELKSRNGGVAPTVAELAHRVAADISAAEDRAAFLQSFYGDL